MLAGVSNTPPPSTSSSGQWSAHQSDPEELLHLQLQPPEVHQSCILTSCTRSSDFTAIFPHLNLFKHSYQTATGYMAHTDCGKHLWA